MNNLLQAAKQLSDYWSPRVVGQINDQYVKVAKVKASLFGINMILKMKCSSFWRAAFASNTRMAITWTSSRAICT